MSSGPARRLRPRITIRHLAVLVAFAAVAVMPRARQPSDSWRLGFVVAVEVPYALLIPTMVLVGRGPGKSWLLAFLCSVPMAVLAASLAARLVGTLSGIRAGGGPLHGLVTVFSLVSGSVVALILAFLSRWVIPRTCPTCRRLALLHDGSVPRADRFEWESDPRTCVACGSRFRRGRRVAWVDVATLPLRPPLAGRPSPILSTATPEHDPR